MRYEDTPELFGGDCGSGTYGDITCGICQTAYNQGADEKGDYNGDSVTWTSFAGLDICNCCFEKIENEVLGRMGQILPWYKRLLLARRKSLEKHEQDCKNVDKAQGDGN